MRNQTRYGIERIGFVRETIFEIAKSQESVLGTQRHMLNLKDRIGKIVFC